MESTKSNYSTNCLSLLSQHDMSDGKFRACLDHLEYGSDQITQLQFSPKSMGILDKYVEQDLIYQEQISSTKIYIVKDKESEKSIIKKVIEKDKLLSPMAYKFAQQECSIHSVMDHSNIVKLYNYTETDQNYILLMEYCDKSNHIAKKVLEKHSPIKDNNKLVSIGLDVLEALDYIHKNQIIHDDIKLDNILLQTSTDDDEYHRAKLCDFGLSQIINPQIGKAYYESKCGTVGYIAPEIKSNAYFGTEIDMFSFGVCLYEMAVAYKPTKLLDYKYGQGSLPFRRVDWKNRGKFLQDLITQCLQIDPTKRITAEDALQHPWFQEEFLLN